MVFPMKAMNLWGSKTFPEYFPQSNHILRSLAPAFGQSLGWTEGGFPAGSGVTPKGKPWGGREGCDPSLG